MSASLRAALALCALLALPGAACGDPTAGEPARTETPDERPEAQLPSGIVVELEVVDAERARQSRFRTGAPIHLSLAVHNRGDEAATLDFSSGRTHDAVIERGDGSIVWRWSDGRHFTQALTSLHIEAGERTRFELACDRSASDLPALAPGTYRAVALVPSFAGELRSKPVPFRIESD